MTVLRAETLLTWPRITVDGAELGDVWTTALTQVRVRLGLRAVGRATVVFDDPRYALAQDRGVQIGSLLTVTSVEDSAVEVFRGKVTSIESDVDATGARYVVVADDAAVALTRTSDVETYHQMSLADVVEKLVSTTLPLEGKSALPSTKLEYVLRNGTPLALVDEIAQRYGLDWAVHDGTFAVWKATTGTAPGTSPVALGVEHNLHAFSVRQVGDATTSVSVRGWDPAQQRATVGTATTPQSRSGLGPANPDGVTSAVTGARLSPSSDTEARALAEGVAARTGRMTARARALFLPELRPGGTVTVDGAGPGNGTYYVREVTHVVDRGGARTELVAGDRDPVTIADPWDQGHTASSFRHSGLVVGVVDGLKDPDARGRVSVSLPTAADQAKSAWARVALPGAGTSRGQMFLPNVGDEVLVGFENDDVARPVVIGGLYSAKNQPPSSTLVSDGRLVGHVIRTSTGHQILLSEDQAEDQQFIELLVAQGQQKLRLGRKGVELVADGGVPLTIKVGESSIAFDGKGAITLKGSTITLDATTKVAVGSKQTVEVSGQTGVTVDGLQVAVKGKSTTKLEAGGMVEIKGSVVKIN